MEEWKPTSAALRSANLESYAAEHSVIGRPNLQWLCRKDLESLTVKVNLIIIHVYFPDGGLLTEGIVTQRRNLQIRADPPRWTEVPSSKTTAHNSAVFPSEIWNISEIPGIHEVTFLHLCSLESVGKSLQDWEKNVQFRMGTVAHLAQRWSMRAQSLLVFETLQRPLLLSNNFRNCRTWKMRRAPRESPC